MKNILTLFISLSFSFTSCQTKKSTSKQDTVINAEAIEVPIENGLAKAYFASGCFWCVEAVYESVNGVTEVINGYAGGHTESPTYELSNTGRTGYAEVNGQGPDRGSQYRSIVFYQNQDQKVAIINKINKLEKELQVKVAAEVYPFIKFWQGEDYHQNYERLHPNNPYVKNVSIPRLLKFKQKFPQLLK